MTFDEMLNDLRTKYPDTMDKADKLLEEYEAADKEYVRRSDLLLAYDSQHKGKLPGKARKIIAEMPAADVKPVVRGEPVPHYETWLNSDMKPIKTVRMGWECPFCGDTDIKNFCPSCGAKMRGKAIDE